MIKCFKLTAMLAALIYFPVAAIAWGQLGHRIVGEIASSYLTPKAKVAVQKILGNESLAMASNWADFVKSDTAFRYLNSWHYIDFKEGLSEAEFNSYLATDSATDAYTKLNFIITQLKKESLPQEKKVMYLRLLVHIIGDIHQPMHTGRPEDMGGNKIKLSWFNQQTNLHSIWDDKIIEAQQLSYTEYAKTINFATPIQIAAWQKETIAAWLYQSHQIAEKLYTEVAPDDKLSYRYSYYHLSILNKQLLEGGAFSRNYQPDFSITTNHNIKDLEVYLRGAFYFYISQKI